MNTIKEQENNPEQEEYVKQQDPPVRLYGSQILYELVTITILILGICDFARSENLSLLYVACAMVASYAGIPVINFLKVFSLKKFNKL